MLIIHPAVDLSTGELLIASEIALNETLSNAPSMSRKVPKTYPFLAILRSMVCAILCKTHKSVKIQYNTGTYSLVRF